MHLFTMLYTWIRLRLARNIVVNVVINQHERSLSIDPAALAAQVANHIQTSYRGRPLNLLR